MEWRGQGEGGQPPSHRQLPDGYRIVGMGAYLTEAVGGGPPLTFFTLHTGGGQGGGGQLIGIGMHWGGGQGAWLFQPPERHEAIILHGSVSSFRHRPKGLNEVSQPAPYPGGHGGGHAGGQGGGQGGGHAGGHGPMATGPQTGGGQGGGHAGGHG